MTVFYYDLETWTVKKTDKRRVKAVTRIYRTVLEISWRERLSNAVSNVKRRTHKGKENNQRKETIFYTVIVRLQ